MSTVLAAPASPYKGLAPYGDSDLDALFFFGRERDRDVIVANLIAARLTVLYGATGVGKSSVLRAGVAHRLRLLAREEGEAPEHEVAIVDTWSGDPVQAVLEAVGASARGRSLADVLEEWTKASGSALYLILDQFDEYFLYHRDEEGDPLGDELAEILARSRLPVNVLISLREDALAQLDAFKGKIPNLFANSLRLDRLDRRAGRSAIVGPIDRYNELAGEDEQVDIEPELVEAVLDEVTAGRVDLGTAGRGEIRAQEGESGIEAPYLQLVMERLWEVERNEGSRALRLETLRRLGGAEAIVRAHLERALAALTPAQRDVAANVFNHLVTPSGTKIAHRAGDLADYAAVPEDELVPVLGLLGRERILRAVNGAAAGSARYEIFHDVLADAVLAWRARQRLERERRVVERRHRRLLIITGIALAAFTLMAALAIYALVQRGDARTRAREARVGAAEASARALEASALGEIDINPQLSLLHAYRAARILPSREAEETLRLALVASRLRKVLHVGGEVVAASFSPDGRRILAAARDGNARIYDARSGRLQHAFGKAARMRTAAFSPDGRFVITAGRNYRATLWYTASGKAARTIRHGAGIRGVSFSGDGSLLATAGGAMVRIWRTADGSLVQTIRVGRQVRRAVLSADGRYVVTVASDQFARVYDAHTGALIHSLDQGGRLTSASFTPSGAVVVTSGDNDTARLWSMATGRVWHTLVGHEGPVFQATVDPRGKLVATASADGTARVWEIGSGGLYSQLTGHLNYVTSAAFSSDGFSVVTTSKDGTARVWRSGGGLAHAVLAGHEAPVTSAAFSHDNNRVITGGEDGTVRIWDPQTNPLLAVVGRYGHSVTQVVRSPDARLVLVASDDGARLVDAVDGRIVRKLAVRGPVTSVAFSRDGQEVATVARGHALVWDVRSGRPASRLAAGQSVSAIDFAPDGEIATAGIDGSVRLWRNDRFVLRISAGDRPLTSVRFDRDGRRFVTGSVDKTAKVFSVDGPLLQTFEGHKNEVTSAVFSPNGRFVLTASRDGDARIWNIRTGRTMHRLVRHFGLVSDAEYSPDGRWIVTAGPVTAGLWSSSGRFYFFLRGHLPVVRSVLFEPGARIITAGTDGTVRAYTCDVCGHLPALLALARARLAAAR